MEMEKWNDGGEGNKSTRQNKTKWHRIGPNRTEGVMNNVGRGRVRGVRVGP